MIISKFPILLISSTTLLISSCAGPETYQDKMERFKARTGENILVPGIKVSNINFLSETKSGRAPASTTTSDSSMTNKKLYFLSLYAQYETFKSITGNDTAPEINLCPSFHTGLLTYKEKKSSTMAMTTPQFTYQLDQIRNETYLNTHPELFLPVSKDSTSPKVVDLIQNKNSSEMKTIVQEAVNLHIAKTYKELQELCSYGTSSNYYIFENLTTHLKTNRFSATNENMNILLKTTLFSNRALITSFSRKTGRSIASVVSKTPYSDEVATRLNVKWSNEYFTHIQSSN